MPHLYLAGKDNSIYVLGNDVLDKMGLRAVQMAAPFGRLPAGFTGNKLELRCELNPIKK